MNNTTKYKIVGERGNIPFEISPDEINHFIETRCYTSEIKLTEYLFDKLGNICGVKGLVDLGHGYGFNNGWKEFEIKLGETYSFIHEYTSIDGPSDWSKDSFKVTMQLVKFE